MKKYFILIPILFIAIFLTGCTKTEYESDSQNPTNEEVSDNWQNYSDEQHNFEFQYIKNGNSSISYEGRPTGLIFSVQKDGVEALYGKFEKEENKISSECKDDQEDIGEIEIGGIPTRKCSNHKKSSWSATIQKENIDETFDTYTMTCSNERDNFYSYCDQLLSTFKFVN